MNLFIHAFMHAANHFIINSSMRSFLCSFIHACLPACPDVLPGIIVHVPCPLQMVSWMCNLEASCDLIGRLEALADRHVDYGCRPLHCE